MDDSDIKAAALREFADLIDKGPPIPLPPNVYSALAREKAEELAAASDRHDIGPAEENVDVIRRRERERIGNELLAQFHAMRENGDNDMRTVIHHVLTVTDRPT